MSEHDPLLTRIDQLIQCLDRAEPKERQSITAYIETLEKMRGVINQDAEDRYLVELAESRLPAGLEGWAALETVDLDELAVELGIDLDEL